jgi:hypothetical protein
MRVKTISPARNEPSSSRGLRMGSVDSRPAEVIGADSVFIGGVISGYSGRPAASQTVAVYATGTVGVACKYSSGIGCRYPDSTQIRSLCFFRHVVPARPKSSEPGGPHDQKQPCPDDDDPDDSRDMLTGRCETLRSDSRRHDAHRAKVHGPDD